MNEPEGADAIVKASAKSSNPLTPVPMRRWQAGSEQVARDLIGRYLVRRLPLPELGRSNGRRRRIRLILKIVETEAYLGTPDRASHAFNGRKTDRTRTLHLPGGYAYVYFIYGMYHCLNVVAGDDTNGEAVLIRAGEPIEGIDTMVANRTLPDQKRIRPGQIAGGPGKLCQALAIDRRFDAVRLDDPRSSLFIAEGQPVVENQLVATGPRIGIDYAGEAKHWPLRFAIRGHPGMSKPILR